MLIKVTALVNVSVNDPVGLETVSTFPVGTFGNPIIELDQGEYREYTVLEQQGNRLIPLLDAAQTAGMLTYTVVRIVTGGGLSVEDEGVPVEPVCTVLDFIGADVQAIAVGGNKVEVHHPPPIFSPSLGLGSGALAWPLTIPGYVSRPEGGEGVPYYSGGWAIKTTGNPRINSTGMAQFTTGLGITHTSPRVSNLQLGQITAIMTDGLGNTETLTLGLNPSGGDQIVASPSGRVVIRVQNTVIIGTTVEGEVHVRCDPVAFLGLVQSGTGGYFKVEVNHTASPTSSDFGDAFWDDGALPVSIIPTVVPVVPVPVWISGIRYFDTASTFRIEDSSINGAQHGVNMTINDDATILVVDVSDFSVVIGSVSFESPTITGLTYLPALSPLRTDRPRYAEVFAVGSGDLVEGDARVRTTWVNFSGDEVGSPKESVSGVYQINTANRSTDSTETYDRETYRLQAGVVSNFKQTLSDYRAWFGGGGGSDKRNWDATQSIVAGTVGHIPGLQYRAGRLIYPVTDFSAGFFFADFDYSGVVGACWAYRAFDVGDLLNHKRFTITMEVAGINLLDLDIGVGGDDSTAVRVDCMFPGPERVSPNGANDSSFSGSGWLHCGKMYNAPVFIGVDSEGCLDTLTQLGNIITVDVVTGNMSSEYTQGTLLVRVRYANGFNGTIGQVSVIGA